MTDINAHPSLPSLPYLPYLDAAGNLNSDYQGQVGVYAVFDADKTLQFIGYSRDVALSLKQHFVRQSDKCYWLKVVTINRPSRSVLENIRDAWIAENGAMPPGNGDGEGAWTEAIDVKPLMTPEEQQQYQQASGDPLAETKVLKNIARRVEADIFAVLENRGLQEKLRFNPKLKEQGLLDLK